MIYFNNFTQNHRTNGTVYGYQFIYFIQLSARKRILLYKKIISHWAPQILEPAMVLINLGGSEKRK